MKAGKHSPRKRAATSAQPRTQAAVSPEKRHAMIAEAAYFRAAQRGFAPGAELDDWLAAEAQIDRALGEPTLLEHQLAHSDT